MAGSKYSDYFKRSTTSAQQGATGTTAGSSQSSGTSAANEVSSPKPRVEFVDPPIVAPPPPPPQPQGPVPQVPLDRKTCNWAMVCHLAGLSQYVGITLGHIIVPLVLWLINRHDSSFLDKVGKEALNFQISFTIYMVIAMGVSIWTENPLPILIVALADIVLVIRATIKAKNGFSYSYPARIPFIR